jgi:type I restriction enzyme S subunit
LAPFPEQQRIVKAIESYLTRIDDAAVSLERVQVKLKTYRASVLKAAVEGRLVSTEASLARFENRAYEPAAVLLARMLKERRRRWEEARLDKLRVNGKAPEDEKWRAKYAEPAAVDTSKLPELPEGWCWASADQVGDILLGRQRSPAYLTGRWFRPYLRVANIKDDRIDFGDVEQMDFDPNHYEKYRLLTGDILVSEGQSPHLVGQSAIYRGELSDLCFQKTLHRFRPIPGAPRSEFAQIVFRANVMLGVFKQVAPITTNIAHLTLEKFKASRFPLPPVLEQLRIEEEVERLLSITDAAERQVRIQSLRLDRLRQSVLKWAFEGKLVDQNPTDEAAAKLLARIRAERASTAPMKKGLRRAVKDAT